MRRPLPSAGARPSRRAGGRGGFSIVEMLVALTITSLLLTATLSALDVSYKAYKATSESASDQLVSRLVMHRVLAMLRTGKEFGPYPADVLDAAQNPGIYDRVEFVSFEDEAAGVRQVTRLERRPAEVIAVGSGASYLRRGPYILWMVVERTTPTGTTTTEQPLLDGVLDLSFTLEYLPGPTLRRATMDLTVRPRGEEVIVADESGQLHVESVDEAGNVRTNVMVGARFEVPVIRLVASTTPRQLD